MVFSSALFLFAFLPLTYILDKVMRSIKGKNYILTAASLLFYSFGRLDWLLLLIVSVICNYLAGVFIMRGEAFKKPALVVALCVNLGLLCVFKYLNFFTSTINGLGLVSITPTNIALPIGISFFTFQGMSYVIDVYRNPQMGTKSFLKVLLYISFFPQLVAGPIVKYGDISEQIDARESTPELTISGIKRFVLGLVKKLFFANELGYIADMVYSLESNLLDFRLAWIGVICYTLQIYYDFSAYSDMAIGLGKIFGFRINENFAHPYCATSIKDFWRRWHISLSSWFKEYLYIPLGGNRRGKARARINRLIVFFFTGMWHGANWTFILWGLWHGLFLMIEDILPKRKVKIAPIKHIYTMLVVMMGFMLFRASNLSQAADMLKAMYTGFDFGYQSTMIVHNIFTPYSIAVFVGAVICVMPIADKSRELLSKKNVKIPQILKLTALMLVFVMCAIKLAASSFNPFIYTQF